MHGQVLAISPLKLCDVHSTMRLVPSWADARHPESFAPDGEWNTHRTFGAPLRSCGTGRAA
jgi:hypothetical protein